MPRTYIPDAPVKVTELPDGVILETQTEPGTGICKRIEIHLAPDRPSATLTHTLVNKGLWPVELAVWGITQFRLEGVVTMPVPTGKADPAGLLPNRQLSFWPYARINDPRLILADDFIRFQANALPSFKMGYFNRHGWLAYELDGSVFKKSFQVYPNSPHPDNNSNAEIYGNNEFVELESLSPLEKLNPGDMIEHVERWDILDKKDW